jgi:hypothetical protein
MNCQDNRAYFFGMLGLVNHGLERWSPLGKALDVRRAMMPSNRAIEAVDRAGNGGTATWFYGRDGWYCYSASRHLRWMKGMSMFGDPVGELARRGFTWTWIVPALGVPVEAPF